MKTRISWLGWLLLLAALGPALPSEGRVLLRGFVRAADSGHGLTAATVQVEGTYVGTVANDDGEYALYVDRLPVVLVATCIGYRSQTMTVADSSAAVDFALQSAPPVLAETIVTGEDPAVKIMRQVLAAKQRWRPSLRNYRVDVYSRWTVAKDSGVVGVVEAASEMYWDQQRGWGEHIEVRRTTASLQDDSIFGDFSAVDLILNFYEDDISLLGHRLMGPTHPHALEHYRFELVGQRRLDQALVYDIAFAPRSELQAALAGTLAVLDSTFALLEVDLAPNKTAMQRPTPGVRQFDLHYRQQYRSFGTGVWLPVDFYIGIDFEFAVPGLEFPFMRRDIIQRLSNYQLNVELPDSLFGGKQQGAAASAAVQDSLLAPMRDAVPLSQAERAAYAEIDSAVSLAESFAPSGLLAGLMPPPGAAEPQQPSGLEWRPQWRVNRVESLALGLASTVNWSKRWTADLHGAYNTGQKDWDYGGQIQRRWGDQGQWGLAVAYRRGVEARYHSVLYGQTLNSLAVLAGGEDYFDYFQRRGLSAGLAWAPTADGLRLEVQVLREAHRSLANSSRFDPLDRYDELRANPVVQAGALRSVALHLRYGRDYAPWSPLAYRRAVLSMERGFKATGGNFSFTRYHLLLDGHFTTLLPRRAPPHVLALRLVAGTASGAVPVQRLGIIEVSAGPLTPFGALRTLDDLPYQGERYLGFFAEQYLRTLPVEILGLQPLAARGVGLIVHGATARTWKGQGVGRSDGWHSEAGVSLVLFHLLRFDFTRRLDRTGWSVGIGVAPLDFDAENAP